MMNPSEEGSARPMPCPECTSTKGYSRVGKFRVQCKDCNSTIPNAEVGIDDQEEQ